MKTEIDKMYDVMEKKEVLAVKIFDLIQAFEVETGHSLGNVETYYLPLFADHDGVKPNGFIDDIELHMCDEFNNVIFEYETAGEDDDSE